jgi:hypothetical protein
LKKKTPPIKKKMKMNEAMGMLVPRYIRIRFKVHAFPEEGHVRRRQTTSAAPTLCVIQERGEAVQVDAIWQILKIPKALPFDAAIMQS